MANIVITSDANSFEMVFNTKSSEAHVTKATFSRSNIAEVVQLDGGGVVLTMAHTHGQATAYQFSFDDNNGGMQVDSVDAAAPATDSALYDKLAALIIA